MTEVYTYDAFISYSQAEDGKLAPAIQSALQKINAPWHGLSKPLLHVFRDATNLGKSPGRLTDSIKEGIKASRKFILLCSPKARESPWVNQETEYYKVLCAERGINPSERIIIVVTEGNIKWDYEKKDWDWQNTNVLPDGLLGCFDDVPLWVDLKDVKKETNLNIKSTIFRNSIVRIAAFLLDKEPAEIDSIELRNRKTQKQIITGVLCVLLIMLATSIFFGISENTARKNEQTARKNEQVALKKAVQKSIDEEKARKIADQKTIDERKARLAEEQARKVAEQKTIDERKARLAEEQARKVADQKTIDERKARLAEEQARKVADQKTIDERRARQSTDTLNNVLAAENLALNSLLLNDPLEKAKKAIEATELYKFHNPRNNIHLAKKPTLYYALYDAYLKNNQASARTYDFEIEKVRQSGEAIGMHHPLDNRFIYNIQYLPGIDLPIKSLDNKTIYIGTVKHPNLASVTAADYIKSRSVLITGHDDGQLVKWEYQGPDKNKPLAVLRKLPGKVIWLSQYDDNTILAATTRSLYAVSDQAGLDTIMTFKREIRPTAFEYCLKDKLIFIGYQTGDIAFYRLTKENSESQVSYTPLPAINYKREFRTLQGKTIFPAIGMIRYNPALNMVAFSTSAGKLFLYQVDPAGNPFIHYEMIGIKYQQPIKDMLISDNGIITVAFRSEVIQWPAPEKLLFERLINASATENLTAK